MPPTITAVTTPDGTVIYVETVEIYSAPVPPGGPARAGVEGARTEIGFSDTLSMLRASISGIGGALRGALGKAQPDEMTVALNFVLKGEVNVIPVLMQGSGEGSIKVELKWKAAQNAKPEP
jgi:hypothetical protein